MTQVEKDRLIKLLSSALDTSEKDWKEGEKSHAAIIGYLQGTIRSALIIHLDLAEN